MDRPVIKKSFILITAFLFLTARYAYSQNQPATSVPAAPVAPPIFPNTTIPSLPSTAPAVPATTDPSGSTNPNGKPKNSGKYEEYQSICLKNEYDTIANYPTELKEKKINLIKIKMADAKDNLIKFELLLAKEYIDQGDKTKFNDLVKTLKLKKISSMDNDYLNSLIAISTGNYSTARKTLNKLLLNNPEDAETLILLAEVYMAEANYYEASTIYEDLNLRFKNLYLVEHCQTLVLNFLNADGEKLCMKASTKFPENPFPHIYSGITHRERNELKKAQDLFKKSIMLKPTEMGFTCLAEIFYMNENYKEAAVQFNKSIDIRSNSERGILGLAWSELKLKNYDESLQAFKKACKLNGKHEFELRRAYKTLSADKIPEAKKFIDLAEACGK